MSRRTGGIVHTDDVPAGPRTSAGEVPGYGASWQDLGSAAGAQGVGLARMRIEPGQLSTPPHRHSAEEELFYVLAGEGLAWQDGATFEVRAGDCLLYLPSGPAHTLQAGPAGLDVLAFGERRPAELSHLPRTGTGFLGDRWTGPEGPHPWLLDRDAGPLELPPAGERPANVVHLDAVQRDSRWGATVSRTRVDLGAALGSRTTGLKHVRVSPNQLGAPPHCHSAEEELFVALAGAGTLLLGDDEHEVRAGHVVSRPAGTGVAHAFRAGPEALVLLAYGTRRPEDACWYPRSGKISFPGLGVVGRLEPADLWEGEG
jgi:uncharacterized cupin superfamily protein